MRGVPHFPDRCPPIASSGEESGIHHRAQGGCVMRRSWMALLLCAAPGVALAATPSNGTMGPTTTVVRYDGSALAGGAQGDPVGIVVDAEDTCVEGVSCDTFTLTVAGTPADWAGKGVHVKISWLLPTTDYDLYVHKGTVDGVEACH